MLALYACASQHFGSKNSSWQPPSRIDPTRVKMAPAPKLSPAVQNARAFVEAKVAEGEEVTGDNLLTW